MPYETNNEYYMTMETEINENGDLIAFNQDVLNSLKHACEFERFLNKYDLTEHIKLYGETEKTDMEGPENVFEDLFGYNMPEGWKHTMVDEFINDMSIGDIETFINDIGFIKCLNLANDCGFYDEDDYKKALLSKDGLCRFFYCVLYQMIEIADGIEEIDIPTFECHFGPYWKDDCNDDDDTDDSDADSDADTDEYVFKLPVGMIKDVKDKLIDMVEDNWEEQNYVGE